MAFLIYIAIGCIILVALLIIFQDIRKNYQKKHEQNESDSDDTQSDDIENTEKKTNKLGFFYILLLIAIALSIYLIITGRWQFISFIVLSVIPVLRRLGIFSWLLRLLIAYQGAKLFKKFTQKAHAEATPPQHMDREKALAILGLDDNATHQDIIDAHRRIITKIHPDQGGSEELARNVNHARDILLKK